MTATPVAAVISAAVASRRASLRAEMTRSTPSRASAKAAALPMPALAPLTMALRPRMPRSMPPPGHSIYSDKRGPERGGNAPRNSLEHAAEQAAGPGGLAPGRRNLARFHQLFEPPQVFTDFKARMFPEQPGKHTAQRGAIPHRDPDKRSPAAGGGVKSHHSRMLDIGSVQGAPADMATRRVCGNLRCPLELRAHRASHLPA